MNFSKGAYSGRTTLKFSNGSSYNATDVLSIIRCIKDKHHMQSKYVTWYGHHHLVLMISINEASSWSPTSPALHLYLHRSIVVISPTIASTMSLPLSDKVKQLHGDCISYNKATTIWLLPVVDNFVTKHDHLIQQFISHHAWPYHITASPAKTS